MSWQLARPDQRMTNPALTAVRAEGATAYRARRRRAMTPMTPKPASISAYVSGSGTGARDAVQGRRAKARGPRYRCALATGRACRTSATRRRAAGAVEADRGCSRLPPLSATTNSRRHCGLKRQRAGRGPARSSADRVRIAQPSDAPTSHGPLEPRSLPATWPVHDALARCCRVAGDRARCAGTVGRRTSGDGRQPRCANADTATAALTA